MSEEMGESTAEESSVYMYLLRHKGVLYPADCVEVTKDTAFFQIEGKWSRQGVFPSNRLDLRWFEELEIELLIVHHAPMLEQ